jgi:hypothetical protein
MIFSKIQSMGEIYIYKLLSFILVFLFTMSACTKEENFTYWTEKTDNQIQRLDKANIKYEIREGEIWVKEEDMKKVVACYS